MRLYFLFFILFIFSLSTYAQVDVKKKSIAIPAVKSKDSVDANLLLPSKPINNKSINNINTPRVTTNLNIPKKEFSMFPSEEFGNPGELYEKQLKKKAEELRPEGYGSNGGLKEDAYWGDYRTTSGYIHISYRDSGKIDGDLLSVLVNDDVLRSNVILTGNYKGIKLKLNEGLNKIEFYAINEGRLLPNTAQYKIVDEENKVITGRIWGLSAGVKVTVIIIKE